MRYWKSVRFNDSEIWLRFETYFRISHDRNIELAKLHLNKNQVEYINNKWILVEGKSNQYIYIYIYIYIYHSDIILYIYIYIYHSDIILRCLKISRSARRERERYTHSIPFLFFQIAFILLALCQYLTFFLCDISMWPQNRFRWAIAYDTRNIPYNNSNCQVAHNLRNSGVRKRERKLRYSGLGGSALVKIVVKQSLTVRPVMNWYLRRS